MADAPGTEPGNEDELMNRLRLALTVADPVPADLAATARSLLTWRDPDTAMAALVADSRSLAGLVRGGGGQGEGDILLHFRSDHVDISVQLSPGAGGAHRLVGQVEPAAPGTVRIRRPSGQSDVVADDLGRFSAERIGPGPISLRWLPDGGDTRPVTTAWHLL